MIGQPKFVFHLVEKGRRGKYCAGQWKDIESFNRIIASLGVNFECLEFDLESMAAVVVACRDMRATHIILYYSFLPEILVLLKEQIPHAKLFVRTVNAEAFQHWQRAEITLKPSYGNLRSIYGSARLAWRDSRCKKIADGLLGISEWDNQVYWRRLPGHATVFDVPYSCPWPALRPQVGPRPWPDRVRDIVCLAGGRDPVGRTMVSGFNQLADALVDAEMFREWRFLLSPGIRDTDEVDVLSPRVQRMESLQEPWDLLCTVRALAVLTPLGFGFKTTIVDALAAGCHVLVHPVVARRLPDSVRNACSEIDPESTLDRAEFERNINRPPADLDLNHQLANQAYRSLGSALSIPQCRQGDVR